MPDRAHAPPDTAVKHPRMTAAEITAHPSYPSVTWRLLPTKSGKLKVAEGRGGPFHIAWELHGTGKTKVVVSHGTET